MSLQHVRSTLFFEVLTSSKFICKFVILLGYRYVGLKAPKKGPFWSLSCTSKLLLLCNVNVLSRER